MTLVKKSDAHSSLGMTTRYRDGQPSFFAKAEEACSDTHAIAVLTEWDEFKEMDFESFRADEKPAYSLRWQKPA